MAASPLITSLTVLSITNPEAVTVTSPEVTTSTPIFVRLGHRGESDDMALATISLSPGAAETLVAGLTEVLRAEGVEA